MLMDSISSVFPSYITKLTNISSFRVTQGHGIEVHRIVLVWQVVWNFAASTKEDFRVKYSTILEKCRAFYPRWLAKDTEQITQGRLNDGLELVCCTI